MTAIDHQVTYAATQAKTNEVEILLGRPRVTRTLITAYFDTPDYLLHRSGATFRSRRADGSDKETVEAKIPSIEGLRRTKGDDAVEQIQTLVAGAELHEVAIQTKVRQLHFIGHPSFGLLFPDIVIALDDVSIEAAHRTSTRLEIELQIFTKLPWTKKIDGDRLSRFHIYQSEFESKFGLSVSPVSGYQAIEVERLK